MMPPAPTLTVISLMGGIKPSVMALMASTGAFDHVPGYAIFADTRREPPGLYEHVHRPKRYPDCL